MQPKAAVALLAEGGDRNMDLTLRGGEFVAVALLAEGGDRNITNDSKENIAVSRPPRGGRG